MCERTIGVVDVPHAFMCLDELGEVAHVPYEAERQLFQRPCTSIRLALERFVALAHGAGTFRHRGEVHAGRAYLEPGPR
jgi:hypothetical protein